MQDYGYLWEQKREDIELTHVPHHNGLSIITVQTEDRFGQQVDLPIHVNIAQVNDPMDLTVTHGPEGLIEQRTLTGVMGDEKGSTTIDIVIDEGIAHELNIVASDIADKGIVSFVEVQMPVAPSPLGDAQSLLDMPLNGSSTRTGNMTSANGYPTIEDQVNGVGHQQAQYQFTDGDGNSTELTLHFHVEPVNNSETTLASGASGLLWYQDATSGTPSP